MRGGRLLSCSLTVDREASFLLVLGVFGADPAQLDNSETHKEAGPLGTVIALRLVGPF